MIEHKNQDYTHTHSEKAKRSTLWEEENQQKKGYMETHKKSSDRRPKLN